MPIDGNANDLRRSRRRRWLVWLTLSALWTAALLFPDPDRLARSVFLSETTDPIVREEFDQGLFVLSKTLHLSTYALLAFLGGWLRAPGWARVLLLIFLSAHAAGTELMQNLVPGRHPSWRDVGLDHIGIACGLVMSLPWWLSRPNVATA